MTGRRGVSESHPLRARWESMRARCNNLNNHNYARYGGRGITVCPEWAHFWTFVFDMGKPPSVRHTVDRIDNNGPYAPWNCRWATPMEQQRNSRSQRLVTYGGETLHLSDWAREFGITVAAIRKRVGKHGEDRAFDGLTRLSAVAG